MASLTAISFTLVGGIGTLAVTLSLFGCAVSRQVTYVAARCEARPRAVIYNPKPKHPSQDRGNPMLGWILWVMRLKYDTLLRGVPGTGTRDGGLSGSLLKVNLDGVVLLRFHNLYLRVCSLAAFLYIFIVLPIYSTAQCSQVSGDLGTEKCQHYNLTDYQRLTLANVPTLVPTGVDNFQSFVSFFFVPQNGGHLARLYMVVFCSWIVTWYAMYQLKLEWLNVLALRRVYYLEADVWGDRREELGRTLLAEDHSKKKRHTKGDIHMVRRQPWIPHPEQRDTVPNVELYSLLVGGLPSLPTEVVDREEVEAVFSRKQSTDWQLSVTTAFFDHCVPNQPGFSSSVAAVTILPSASHLAEAWNNWYRAASRLRRLRFIRRQIDDRLRKEIEEEEHSEVAESGNKDDPEQPMKKVRNISKRKVSVYDDSEHKHRYLQEVLGSATDVEVENNLLHALHFGPEQTAVYSREFAQGAANLAPHGCCEGRIRWASVEDLLLMEQTAVERVHEANKALRQAQERIADVSSDGDLSDDDLAIIMKNASTHGDNLFGKPKKKDSTPPDRISQVRKSNQSNASRQSSSSGEFELGYSTDGAESFFEDLSSEEESEKFMPLKPPQGSDSTKALETPPPMRATRNASMPLANISQSLDSSLPTRRPSLNSLKSTTFFDVKRLSGLASLSRKMSGSLSSSGHKPQRRPKRVSVTSAQLPTDLGLEAGLWMEQKNLSIGNSQHLNRRGSDMKRSRHAPKRNYSAPLEKVDASRKNRPTRTYSDDLKNLFDSDSEDDPDELKLEKANKGGKLLIGLDKHRDVGESGDPHEKQEEPLGQAVGPESVTNWQKDGPRDAHDSVEEKADSFWEKLEKDKQRKAKLKAKLESMQSPKRSSSVNSDGLREGQMQVNDEIPVHSSMPVAPNLLAPVGGSESNGGASPSLKMQHLAPRREEDESHLVPIREGFDCSPGVPSKIGKDVPLRIPFRHVDPNSVKSKDWNHSVPQHSGQTEAGDFNDQSNIQTESQPIPEEHLSSTPAPYHAHSLVKHGRYHVHDDLISPDSRPRSLRMESIREMVSDDDGSIPLSWRSSPSKAVSGRGNPDFPPRSPSRRGNFDCDGSKFDPNGSRKSVISNRSSTADDNLRIAFDFETKAGLRQREVDSIAGEKETNGSKADSGRTDKWAKVVKIVEEATESKKKKRKISDGSWKVPSLRDLWHFLWKRIMKFFSWATLLKTPEVVDDLARDSTFAVVTFTSRQAAVAARHCLADSRGAGRWVTVADIPVPPLADAAVCNLTSIRGCVRPVSISINDKQKLIRHNM